MRTRHFEIKCHDCGSDDVALVNYHNEDERGQRLKCRACGAKEEI